MFARPSWDLKDGAAVSSASVVSELPMTESSRPLNYTARRWAPGKATPKIDVLLLDAQFRQTLACMRDYARAGLGVGAVACESEAWWAPSFRSRWCLLRATVPDPECRPDEYVDAVLSLVDRCHSDVLVPAHDGSIGVLRARRLEVERRIALPLASEAALDIAVSKPRTMALAKHLGIEVPRSIRIVDLEDVAPAVREVGFPAMIKPIQSWAQRDGIGTRLSCEPVLTMSEAKRSATEIMSVGGQVVIQDWLPGMREAVSIFYANQRFWAKFAQASYREWPVHGGASVLCESIPLSRDLGDTCERLIQAINLEGCSMIEFRRNREGKPVLLEINPRMAGSVGLAIACGVDFPMMLHSWATGAPLLEVTGYRTGRRLRWLVGDIWNLKCALDGRHPVDVPSRLQAMATFLADFARRPSALDGIDVHDLAPSLVEANAMVLRHAGDRVRRSRAFGWLPLKDKVV